MTERGRSPRISVIVPTRDRPGIVAETVGGLRLQDSPADEHEIVVVDDGSSPRVDQPVVDPRGPRISVVRLEGKGRSAARNRGADVARGAVVLFVDDDISVGTGFVRAHLGAQEEWPGSLIVGAISLPASALDTPFGRFRQELERRGLPSGRGPVTAPNFCAAGNVSISRARFLELGGFDPMLRSSEDQDLALRHSAAGGQIIFLPEAEGIHRDGAMDLASYCRRAEWGSENTIPFCRKHPAWTENIHRDRVNGWFQPFHEPVSSGLRKLAKAGMAAPSLLRVVLAIVPPIERAWPRSPVLGGIYRLVLGAHLLRGYRRGLARFGPWAASPRDGVAP